MSVWLSRSRRAGADVVRAVHSISLAFAVSQNLLPGADVHHADQRRRGAGQSAPGARLAGARAGETMRRGAARIIGWTLCLVVLAFVINALAKQFRQVDWSQVHFRPLPTFAAIACVFAVSGMQLIARWTLLLAYGYPLP